MIEKKKTLDHRVWKKKKKKQTPSQNHPSKLNDRNKKKNDDVYLNLREHLT